MDSSRSASGRSRSRSDANTVGSGAATGGRLQPPAADDSNASVRNPSPFTRAGTEHDTPRSQATRPRGDSLDEESREPHFNLPRRAATSNFGRETSRDPQLRRSRAETSATQPLSLFPSFNENGLRRRSTAISRQSAARGRQSGVGDRSMMPTLAGPDVTPQLVQSYENYVSPGYADLNPAYEQPAAAKPVWSLSKPLPRVVRPGMIPTKAEIMEARQNAELPAENSQRLGLDVDPNDLEAGRVRFDSNPAKLAAQLKDSRAQRENNFLNNIAAAQSDGVQRRTSRASATAEGRTSLQSRRPRTSTITSQLGAQLAQIPTREGEEEDSEERQSDKKPDTQGHPLEPAKSRKSHEEHLDPIPEAQEPPTPYNELANPMDAFEDDKMSVSTFAADPADWPELNLSKIIEPPTIHDEIHNNHTAWSVVRSCNREFLAEFLAVFIQLSIGFSADIAHTVGNMTSDVYTAWAWGFATLSAIYIAGGVSGAHLNPAISVILWWSRGFPKRKIPAYWAAQFLGAFLAGFVVYGLYYDSIQHYLATNNHSQEAITNIQNSFVTSQRYDYITPATALFNELFATAVLVVIVLALGDDQNAPPGAGMNAFIIGLVISLETLAFSYQTGAALNPSRDFGPRLALLALGYSKELFTNPYWFYAPFVGVFCGAFIGATLYDVAIFTGGESPINYPWTRTKRSFYKSKAKWRRRILHTEREAIEDTHWNPRAE